VVTFVAATQNRGEVIMAENQARLLNTLLARGTPVALVSMGDPYLLRSFPTVTAYVAAFSTAPPSETAVVKAAVGEIGFRGKLPVTIPGLAKMGDGLETAGR
jgi:beta-N-acetylhexosaminidase